MATNSACVPRDFRSIFRLPLLSFRSTPSVKKSARPPGRVEHLRRHHFIHGLQGVRDKCPEVFHAGRPSAFSIPRIRKRRLDKAARRNREHGISRPMIVLECPQQHVAGSRDICLFGPRGGTSFDDDANDGNVVFPAWLTLLLVARTPGPACSYMISGRSRHPEHRRRWGLCQSRRRSTTAGRSLQQGPWLTVGRTGNIFATAAEHLQPGVPVHAPSARGPVLFPARTLVPGPAIQRHRPRSMGSGRIQPGLAVLLALRLDRFERRDALVGDSFELLTAA